MEHFVVEHFVVEHFVVEHFVKLPPLESGDRLTRSEFERRYAAMPDLKRPSSLCQAAVLMGGSVFSSVFSSGKDLPQGFSCLSDRGSGGWRICNGIQEDKIVNCAQIAGGSHGYSGLN